MPLRNFQQCYKDKRGSRGLKAIQEQQEIIDSQQIRIEQQQEQIDDLKEIVDELRKRL